MSHDREHRRRTTALAAVTATLTAAVALAPAAGATAEEPVDVERVAYVEVNSNDLRNVADYRLEGTGEPAFDTAVIFAANINHDGESAYLHLNDRVTWTLENADTQIRPLQEQGTDVLLSILGNHDSAGLANFETYAEADAFAAQLADVVERYDLDGIDFDDEYSDYSSRPANDYSFLYLAKALRERLGPDKLITFYAIGPAYATTEYDGLRLGDYVDYAWNPWYGTFDPPTVAGLGKGELSPAAIDLSRTSLGTAVALTERTVAEDYGALITYNLTATNQEAYLSEITRRLTGHDTVHVSSEGSAPTSTGEAATGGIPAMR
ncbi:endo-beta-N-acetylglucosaminidase H [Isoptericola sp. BMS4]|uniref:endo-beta-N-acetylglucosaminidase H n=1 Tax=Isoptericola sp. BMS4 TaxID=2527875 RepID=UPI0014247A5B|nr:endo-beta-N-acetylglucosaminidase H [Isoptericola sp. BMS4]